MTDYAGCLDTISTFLRRRQRKLILGDLCQHDERLARRGLPTLHRPGERSCKGLGNAERKAWNSFLVSSDLVLAAIEPLMKCTHRFLEAERPKEEPEALAIWKECITPSGFEVSGRADKFIA
jgi:hypothetical protein